jgi:dynein heavy chain
VNHMYQFSLNSYLDVFELSLRKSLPDAILPKRLMNIINTLTYNIYNYACTGLFERHKLCFSFQMCIKLEQDAGLVPQPWLDFFLKGNIALEKVKKIRPFEWISDQSWQDIVKLSELCPDFKTLPEDIGKS